MREQKLSPQEERTERAFRAVAAFRKMLPGLTSFARALTRNHSVRVVMAGGPPRTDGNTIMLQPPIELGDKSPHQRELCSQRNELSVLLCSVCSAKEAVFVNILHEISHIAAESFDRTTETDRHEALAHALREHPDKLAEKIRRAFDIAPDRITGDYMGLANMVSPFMPPLFNQLDDIRVDNHMFEARKGTKKMYKGDVWKIFNNPFDVPSDAPEDTPRYIRDLPLNTQIVLGLWLEGCQYEYDGWLAKQVQDHLKDEKLSNLLFRVKTARNVRGVWALAFPVLARLRELGYLKMPEEQEEDDEEEKADANMADSADRPEQGADDSETESETSERNGESPDGRDSEEDGLPPGEASEQGAQSEDSEAQPGLPEGAEGTPESVPEERDSSSDEPESSDSSNGGLDGGADLSPGDERDSDSNESSVEERMEESSNGGENSQPGGSEEGSDESESNNDPRGAMGESSLPEEQGGLDGETESSGEQASGETEDAERPSKDSLSTSEQPDGDSKDSSMSSSSDGGDDSSDERGDNTAPEQQDSHDSSSMDSDDNLAPSSEGWDEDGLGDSSSSLPEGMDGATSDDTSASSDEADEPDDVGDSSVPGKTEERGESKPFDSGVYREDGAVPSPPHEYGGAEGLQEAVDKVHKHGKQEVIGNEDDEEDSKSVQIAIVQHMYFETASVNVAGVREHFANKHVLNEDGHDESEAFTRYGRSEEDHRIAAGMQCDMAIAPKILTPLVTRTKKVFAENRLAARDKNRRSGKVDPKVLGRRAWNNDDRLFGKKTEPRDRSYKVIIAGDISASQSGVSLALTKRAMMAQALICHRAKIDFAVYAHTAVGGFLGDGLTLEVYEIKSFKQRWTDKTQELLENIACVAGNLDGHAVEYYRRKIQREDASDRIIMYYSDGKMPAANHNEELEILQREIKTCKKVGVNLMGVGIRTDSPSRHGLDTVQVDTDEDLIKVVNHIGKMLT